VSRRGGVSQPFFRSEIIALTRMRDLIDENKCFATASLAKAAPAKAAGTAYYPQLP
jgi:hypothetical protein